MYFCKMNLKEANKILFAQARELRMCDAVHKAWYGKSWSYDKLAEMMYRNLDFCVDNRWPSRETMKTLIPEDARHRNGIVVDERWSLLNTTFALVMGDSEAKARYNAFNVGQIHIFDKSRCYVSAKGHASVSVHVYDNASVNVIAEDSAHVLVVRHSASAKIITTGQMTIKECT